MLDGMKEGVKTALRQWTLKLAGPDFERRVMALPQQQNEYGVDPFGFDPDFMTMAIGPFLWLYRNYFRVQTFGIEKVPVGRVLLVANHSGQIPLDAAMIAISMLIEAEPPRAVRSMVEKWVPTLPYVSTFMARAGQIVGTPENCRRLLDAEEAILVFPEGVRGLGKLWPQRYQLQEFGLGFLRLALETHSPVVPAAVIGAEEQSPGLMNLKPLADWLRMPYLNITPTGLPVPLPAKYRIYFGDPLYFHGQADDEDAELDKKVALVKSTIQEMIHRGLAERKHVFR